MRGTCSKAEDLFREGCLLADRGDLPGAVRLLDSAIALRPNSALYRGVKAECLLDCSRLIAAREEITKAIEYDPYTPEHWELRGRIESRLGDFELAAEAFQRALALDEHPHHAVYTLLGAVQYEFDPEAAIASAKRALELDPEWEEAQRVLEMAMKKLSIQ